MDNLNHLPPETLADLVPISEPNPGHLEELLPSLPPVPTGETPTKRWEITSLQPRHREIMRRIIEGATYIEIAQAMGMHVQSIMLICTSPLFRGELQTLEASLDLNVLKRAEELSNEALDTLKVLMRSARSEAIRKTSADSILDRAGYSKVEKKLVGIIDGEAVIRELSRRRRESTIVQETVVDEPGTADPNS